MLHIIILLIDFKQPTQLLVFGFVVCECSLFTYYTYYKTQRVPNLSSIGHFNVTIAGTRLNAET